MPATERVVPVQHDGEAFRLRRCDTGRGSGSFLDRGSVVYSADYHPGGYLPILRPVTVSDDLPTYLPTYQLLPPSQRPPRAAVRLPAQLLLIVAGHDHGVRPHLAAIPRAMVQPPALRHRPPHS